jgi:hypothetical protein
MSDQAGQLKRVLRNPSRLGWVGILLLPFIAGLPGSLPGSESESAAGNVTFNRDIRPILSDTCFPCHGFDANKRKANLRLDTAEGLVEVHEGRQAVAPGAPDRSELWRRVSSTDPKLVMPPPDSGKKLKPEQIAALKQWIAQGGKYERHWAFVPPVRPEAPKVTQADWPRNDIDRFVLANLEAKKLHPSAEAPRSTLLRRVTLDLTGFPPTPAEADAFLADTRPDSYERAVDRLLSEPQYGEHMARYWLDVARYGDTHGLHLDNERSMWPYRDWVVRAFNENLPFDQFTIWQLAGDLLPNPTRDQLIASGFNRCNVSTSEGGAIDEEFQVRYAVDRVETTSTAWLGLTMGCAVCHDHKLDPITQKEFYQVFSIFNNISENAMDGNAMLPPPSLPLPSPEQEKQKKDYQDQIASCERKLRDAATNLVYIDPASLTNAPKPDPTEVVWVEDDFPPGADVTVNSGNEASQWVSKPAAPVFSGERSLLRVGKGLHQVFFTKSEKTFVIGSGASLFVNVYLDPADPPKSVMVQYHTDGWKHRMNWGDEDAIPYGTKGTPEKVLAGPLPEKGKWVRLEVEASRLGLKPGMKVTGVAFTQFDGKVWWDKAGMVAINDPARDPSQSFAAWLKSETASGDGSQAPPPIKELLKKKPADRSEADTAKLREHYLAFVREEPGDPLLPVRAERKAAQEKLSALEKEIPATMISKELEKPRPAWVLIRGEYDKHGEPVGPGVPAVLPPLPAGDNTNRLALARWLVDPGHPLTARVTVNRVWQQFFGTGLVKTTEDFGTKGEWPSHPELLDWLATEFVRLGWDVKAFIRLIVTSATYRQSSAVSKDLAAMDPENRLLARGPRHRLDAETLRDNALFVSQLLNPKMGGKGVRAYQPAGIWEAVGYTTSNTAKYTQDTGDALYRRSLYLFLKRTAPPPLLTTFDAPSREKCTARRERTNTPLQALLTMNDVQFFEASRQLGYRMLRQGGASDADRLRFGFRLVTSRNPQPAEDEVLADALAAQRSHYAADAEAAKKAISVGDSPVPSDVAPVELAAYTMIANLLLNLDEVITKN